MGISLANLLTAFLYENGYLILPGLGRFDILGGEDLSQPEKVKFSKFPDDFIQFKYNTKESTDAHLIHYITAHTRKMESLAAADLASFADQALQMLNLLQPVSFPGIGTISKGTRGQVEFETGEYMADVLKEPNQSRTRKKRIGLGASSVPSVSTVPVKRKPTRSIGGMLIILVCIVIVAVLVYFIFSNKDSEVNVTPIEKKDTSLMKKRDAVKTKRLPKWTTTPPKTKGMIHYQVVFAHSVDQDYAVWRDSQLTEYGHTIIMTQIDSDLYNLAVPVTSLISDTARVKDSLRIFYGSPTTIRYKTGS